MKRLRALAPSRRVQAICAQLLAPAACRAASGAVRPGTPPDPGSGLEHRQRALVVLPVAGHGVHALSRGSWRSSRRTGTELFSAPGHSAEAGLPDRAAGSTIQS